MYVSNEAFNPTWSSTLFFISLSVDRIVDSPRWPRSRVERVGRRGFLFDSIHFARFLKRVLCSPIYNEDLSTRIDKMIENGLVFRTET